MFTQSHDNDPEKRKSSITYNNGYEHTPHHNGHYRRQRLIARKGVSRVPKAINSLAFFLSDSKLCFTVDFNGERFFLDESLSEIEKLLDPRLFFRVSRQLIIHVDAIKEFRSIEFSKIELTLFPNNWIKLPVVISQITAPVFKRWLSEL